MQAWSIFCVVPRWLNGSAIYSSNNCGFLFIFLIRTFSFECDLHDLIEKVHEPKFKFTACIFNRVTKKNPKKSPPHVEEKILNRHHCWGRYYICIIIKRGNSRSLSPPRCDIRETRPHVKLNKKSTIVQPVIVFIIHLFSSLVKITKNYLR